MSLRPALLNTQNVHFRSANPSSGLGGTSTSIELLSDADEVKPNESNFGYNESNAVTSFSKS